MAQAIKPMTFLPDEDNVDLSPFTVLPDTRDLYALRGMAEDRGWPTEMALDPVRQAYALGFLAARRKKEIEPTVKFEQFVKAFALQLPDADGPEFQVDPTNGELSDG